MCGFTERFEELRIITLDMNKYMSNKRRFVLVLFDRKGEFEHRCLKCFSFVSVNAVVASFVFALFKFQNLELSVC